MLQLSLNRMICSTVVVLASNKYRKGCTRLIQTTQPLFHSNPLSSDPQPTSPSWIR